MSTGIGLEVAVPHVRHKSIIDFTMALGIQKNGLEYDSIDNKPVKLIFMIGASDKQDKEYIIQQLLKVIKIAKLRGYAIAIGHPRVKTLEVLKNSKELFKGVELVYVKDLK